MGKKKKVEVSENQVPLFLTEEETVLSTTTEEQVCFIETKTKDSIILSATAGSGKTFSSVERLKFLLSNGVDPSKIIFFSFTNAATKELKKRIGREDVDIRTIHSFCGNVLSRLQKGKSIVSFFDFIDWFKKNYKPKGVGYEEMMEFEELVSSIYDEAQYIESSIGTHKLQKADGIKSKVPEYFSLYQQFLFETKSRDFSDMLIEVRDLFNEDRNLNIFKNKYDYIFVDEYQDTSSIQMQILLKLNAKYYYLIGDRNQSIYNYSGASCEKIESMLKARRNTVHMNLTKNFRSDKVIVENSNKHSSLLAVPHSQEDGYINKKILHKIDDLIDVLSGKGEVAVLVRTNKIIKKLEEELLKRNVPIRYFNYITSHDIESYHKDKMSNQTKHKFENIKKHFDDSMTKLFAFLKSCEDSKKFITSIHKSKGLEFETCVVVNSISRDILEENDLLRHLSKKQLDRVSFDPDDEEGSESKNIHYVAVSRSKHKLFYMIYDK